MRAAGKEATGTVSATIVGKRIKVLRVLHGLKQQELAAAAGISVSHLCKIEAGKHHPHQSTLVLIAKVLRTTAEALKRAYQPGD